MSARCVDCLNEAIERCEVTGVPLCAEHLWYADDGRRVSERVAKQLQSQGKGVQAPGVYLEALGHVAALPRLPAAPLPHISRQRNGNDIIAVLALVSGVISIATCFGIGIAICVPPLPLVPLLLGSIGLAGARNATKPDQARLFSWIGIIGGAGFVALVLLAVIGSVAFGTTNLIPSGPIFRTTPTPGISVP
jgi:thiol:disulfide interchange protein